jgi:hypothetical protein
VSWLNDYLQYTSKQESPQIFHFWNAITTVAATLNRKVYLPMVSDGILRYINYPGQMMIILVAGSGRLRKSTSMRLPKTLLDSIKVRVLDGKTSPEKLLSLLGGHGQHDKKGIIAIFAPELSVFFSRQQYAESLIDIITDLSDAPDRKDFPTQKGGDIWVRDACITFFGATTPSSLAEAIPQRAHQHGFMSRFIFVYASATDRKESLSETKPDPAKMKWATELKARLSYGLDAMNHLSGPFDYTPEARDWYDAWYSNFSNDADKEGEGWVSRRQDHMLRVAMVLQVCKNQLLEIDVDSLKDADAALKMIEDTMPEAFAQIGIHSSSSGVDRILALFKKYSGKATNYQLFDGTLRYFPDAVALKRAVTGLAAAGWIKRESFDAATGTETWSLIRPDLRMGSNGGQSTR